MCRYGDYDNARKNWRLCGRYFILDRALELRIAFVNAAGLPLLHRGRQEWKDFSWSGLVGHWKGSVENTRAELGAKKKVHTDKPLELSFINAEVFMRAHGGSCQGLPRDALMVNGQLWESGKTAKEYDAFVPAEDNKVAYGRVSIDSLNGKEFCRFRHFGA